MEVQERFFALSLSLSVSVLLATVGSLWAGEIRISWQAPTTNEDGSTPLLISINTECTMAQSAVALRPTRPPFSTNHPLLFQPAKPLTHSQVLQTDNAITSPSRPLILPAIKVNTRLMK